MDVAAPVVQSAISARQVLAGCAQSGPLRVGKALARLTLDDGAPIRVPPVDDSGLAERREQSGAGRAGKLECRCDPFSGPEARIGQAVGIALEVDPRREVTHPRERAMQDGHVLLQAPHGAYRLGRETTTARQEIEYILSARAHDLPAHAQANVNVAIGRKTERPHIHAPFIGQESAAAEEDGLWSGGRTDSATPAHSRSSSHAMTWAS